MFQSPNYEPARGGSALSVLVVDDEPTLRLGFAYALTSPLTKVTTAATGQQALDKIALERFDVIVLDLRMPDLDGIGVIEALRGDGNLTPVILCSAALTPNAALRAIRHGVVDFLLKPVRPSDLRQAIQFVILPGSEGLPLAMKAARDGGSAEAIRILESLTTLTRQAFNWLTLLKAMRDTDATDAAALEADVRTSLSTLAFNAPPGA